MNKYGWIFVVLLVVAAIYILSKERKIVEPQKTVAPKSDSLDSGLYRTTIEYSPVDINF